MPLFLLPARWMGRRLQALTREPMGLNADMSTQMTERFNVAGALLVKLFGRPEDEAAAFSNRAGARARHRRPHGDGEPLVLHRPSRWSPPSRRRSSYGLGGNLVIQGVLTIGTLLALVGLLAQLYGPLTALSNVRVDVMTALVSFERVFEVLDLKPMVSEAPDARALPDGPLSVAFDDVRVPLPAGERGVAGLAGVGRARGVDRRPRATS